MWHECGWFSLGLLSLVYNPPSYILFFKSIFLTNREEFDSLAILEGWLRMEWLLPILAVFSL